MKHRKRFSIGLACLLPLVAMTQSLHAQMNYQGRLTDTLGNAINDGQYAIEFRLFSASTGGTELWGPFTAANVDVVAGRFNTIIGATDTHPSSRSLTTALNNPNIYLQIKVGTNAPLTPRQQILAAPKALHADFATNATNSTNATNATNANHATTADTAANFTSVVLKTDEVNGRVGIGTAAPAAKLHVENATTVPSAIIGAFPGGSASLDLRAVSVLNGPGSWRFATTPVFTTLVPSVSHTGGELGIAPVGVTGTAGPTALTVRRNGNVGIGTTTPGFPLSFPDSTGDKISLYGQSGATFGFGIAPDVLQIHTNVIGSDIVFGYGSSAAMTETMRIKGSGRVGIGTTTPRAPLEVGTSVAGLNLSRSFAYPANLNPASYSIIAQDKIYATGFEGTSDMRIKNIISRSDSAKDLNSLMDIAITDYTMKDFVSHGAGSHKKVIAQELERIYPQAVNKSTGTVPDIFQKAAFKDGWVSLETNLKPGERVRLIGEKSESTHEVLEIADGRFRTDFATGSHEIFVYGREVNDFRTVDYDAIAMLNVSATQQIKKEKDAEVAALKEEIAELRERVSALDSMVQARDLKFTSLEKRLDALDPPVSRTVSMKSSDSAH
jgi:hypothetical protein